MNGFLLAYFLSEDEPDGEQVRFAVSDGPEPITWTPINDGRPVLASTEGERGIRDPFLIRDVAAGLFYMIGTDLRVWPRHDWRRAVRFGSRSLVVAESADLINWSAPRLQRVAPAAAGNTWAPKAFWSEPRHSWLVFWASALFDSDDLERDEGSHQRILVAETRDFRTFSDAEVYLDAGHDVIDMTFLEHRGDWFRFSVNAQSIVRSSDLGHHIFEERGSALESPDFEPVAIDIGKGVMARAEGPAVAASPTGDAWFLLADEYGLRGYQVFETRDLASGGWRHRPDAALPAGARHGSLLAITDDERRRLLTATHFPCNDNAEGACA